MIITRVFEDNGGGLSAIVRKDDSVVGVFGGFEYERPSAAAFIDAAAEGFPDADPFDPDEWSGLSIQDAADSIENYDGPGYDLIAVISPESVELFPRHMGYAGRQLFGLLHADD